MSKLKQFMDVLDPENKRGALKTTIKTITSQTIDDMATSLGETYGAISKRIDRGLSTYKEHAAERKKRRAETWKPRIEDLKGWGVNIKAQARQDLEHIAGALHEAHETFQVYTVQGLADAFGEDGNFYETLFGRKQEKDKSFFTGLAETYVRPWIAIDPGSSEIRLVTADGKFITEAPYFYAHHDDDKFEDVFGEDAKIHFWAYKNLHANTGRGHTEDNHGNPLYKATANSRISDDITFNKILEYMRKDLPWTQRKRASILLPVDGYEKLSQKTIKGILAATGYKYIQKPGTFNDLQVIPRSIATSHELMVGKDQGELLSLFREPGTTFYAILDLGAESINLDLMQSDGPGHYTVIQAMPSYSEMLTDLKQGGHSLVTRLVSYFRETDKLSVGYTPGERILVRLGEKAEPKQEEEISVEGISLGDGKKKTIHYSAKELDDRLLQTDAVNNLVGYFDRMKDVTNHYGYTFIGVFAVGGLAGYKPLLSHLQRNYRLPIEVVEDPRNTTVKGLQRIITDRDLLNRYAVGLKNKQ